MNQCKICNKTFKSLLALSGHKRMHGESNGKIVPILASCLLTKKVMPYQYLNSYQSKLTPCKHCNKLIKPTKHALYFCSHSCSASYNNLRRLPRTAESRAKTSKSLTKINIEKVSTKIKTEIVGPFSKLFVCSCKHCKIKFVSRLKKQYCIHHRHLYSESNKQGYKFTFNVFDYPDLFDLTYLQQIGWFSPGGKSGKWNIKGLSRDHKVSVNESIANNYDPYYITHPLNCELMPHSKNNKKKTNSSITYTELKILVDSYKK